MVIAGAVLAVILSLAGVAGSVLPLLPSTPLILVAGIVVTLTSGLDTVGWGTLIWLTVLTVLSQLLDYVATVYGAKKMGAGKWGTAGAFAGGIIGMFFGIAGIILFPVIGAFLGELLLGGKDAHASLKSGFGAFLGFLGGAAGKLVIAVAMCFLLLWAVLG